MTLQERQKREIAAIRKELHMLTTEKITLSHKITVVESESRVKRKALKLLQSDPETYFKNIDKEE